MVYFFNSSGRDTGGWVWEVWLETLIRSRSFAAAKYAARHQKLMALYQDEYDEMRAGKIKLQDCRYFRLEQRRRRRRWRARQAHLARLEVRQ